MNYIQRLADDFLELHGDRLSRDDPALVAGLGTWGGLKAMILGQQKGRTFDDRVRRNFGMMHPEGYRKAIRVARTAARFRLPIISLVDTPGAYPGVSAEEGGIASSIAAAISEWFRIQTPIVAVVIGEGGSGGALALAIADRVLMMENAIYSVAAPEVCASILWRDTSYKYEAAQLLHLTAHELLALGVVDEVIPEPAGGAQCDYIGASSSVGRAVRRHLVEVLNEDQESLLQRRYDRYRTLSPAS